MTSLPSHVMRAIRVSKFGGPEVLQAVADAVLPTPTESQVLIKVHYAGVNPVDTYIRTGTHAVKPALPYTPGNDLAGVVSSVGKNVHTFKPGDRVYTFRTASGSYAEYATAEENTTNVLPACLSFQQGAALGVAYFTAYRALHTRAQARPGESVLIHGASGAVGLALCQMARSHGNTVLGTAGSSKGAETVRANGGHQVFNHREDNYVDKIMESTSEHGVDVIIEMLSNVNLENDLKMLAPKGRVIVLGSRGIIELNPRLTMSKETDIRGVALFSGTKEDFRETGCAIHAGIEAGWLSPVVGQIFALEDTAKADLEVIEHSAGTQGKIVIEI